MTTDQQIKSMIEKIKKIKPGTKEYYDLISKKNNLIMSRRGTDSQDTFSSERNENFVTESQIAWRNS